ncbi:hypothetical protein [Streptomyces chromofuscus]|uniref:hypothetical protein n=1 Tax=Streptomyces chromofuscus TaxID=42881 RepID=UPI001E50F806|nr:hypothetical protein [Streptomyces chromofuscus]
MVETWWEASMQVFARTADRRLHHRVLLDLPTSRAVYPPRLHDLLNHTLASARTHPDRPIRDWATAVGRDEA